MNRITFTKKKCNKEINSLDTKNKEKFDHKKLRFSDHQYLSEEEQEEKQKPIKDDAIALNKSIFNEETEINEELFKKYFNYQRPSDMLDHLHKTNDSEKNNKLVSVINSGLKDFKEEIEKISKEEKEIEGRESIVEIAEEILKSNKQNQQKGQGIKILTPNQMLLPIALAQLQARNNSNKLKNEIRQLLYSLYRSKNMTEQIYKSLVGII